MSMSEKPVGAGIAVGSYSSAEVEELRLQYRDEALKAVEAARQRALAEAKEHYQDTIRRLEEDRDRLAASLAEATAKTSFPSAAAIRDVDGNNVCMNCGGNSNSSNSSVIKSTMEKIYRCLKQEFGNEPAMTSRLKRALLQATESMHDLSSVSATPIATAPESLMVQSHAPRATPGVAARHQGATHPSGADVPAEEIDACNEEPIKQVISDSSSGNDQLVPVIRVEPMLSHFFDSSRKIRYRLVAKLSPWASPPGSNIRTAEVVTERRYSDFIELEKRLRDAFAGRRGFILPALAPKDSRLALANESSIRRRVQFLTSWLRTVMMHREIQQLPNIFQDFMCNGRYPAAWIGDALTAAAKEASNDAQLHRDSLLSHAANLQNEQYKMSSKIHPCLEASSRLLSTLSHYDAAADGMLRATSTGMGTDADEALRLIGSSMISARSAMLATRDFFVHLSDCTRFFADPCIQASTAVFSHALDTSSGPIPSSVLHDAIRDWHRLLWLHAYDRNEACKDALSSMLESISRFPSPEVRPAPTTGPKSLSSSLLANDLKVAVRAEIEVMDEKYQDALKRSRIALSGEDKHFGGNARSVLSGASIAKSLLSFGSIGVSLGVSPNTQETLGRQDVTSRQSDNTFESFEASTMNDMFEEFEELKHEGAPEIDSLSPLVDEEAQVGTEAKTKDIPGASRTPQPQSNRRVVGLRHRAQKPSVTNNATAVATEAAADASSNAQDGNRHPPAGKKPASYSSSNSYSWETTPQTSSAVPATTQTQAPLPDGWEEVTLPDSSVYYYHKQTRETSWNRPAFQKSVHANNNATTTGNSTTFQPADSQSVNTTKNAGVKDFNVKETVNYLNSSEDPEVIVRDVLNGWMKFPNTSSLRNICDLLNTVGAILPTISISEEFIVSFEGKRLNIRTSSPDEIRKYFLKMARFIHPDKLSSGTPQVERAVAEAAFIVLNEAYNRYKFGNGIN